LGGSRRLIKWHVRDDTNNFAHRRLARIHRPVWNDAFTNRIFAGKKLFRETLGNNRDRWRISIIAVGERATAPNRNAHRLEIIRRDHVYLGNRLLARRDGMLFSIEAETDFAAAQRNPPRRSNQLQAWKCRDAIKQFFVKLSCLLRLAVLRFRQRHSRRRDVGRIEPSGNLLQPKKTFDQQSRAREQHQRENDLDHDQRGARASTRCAFSRAARIFV